MNKTRKKPTTILIIRKENNLEIDDTRLLISFIRFMMMMNDEQNKEEKIDLQDRIITLYGLKKTGITKNKFSFRCFNLKYYCFFFFLIIM
jgi:hypothetical protein